MMKNTKKFSSKSRCGFGDQQTGMDRTIIEVMKMSCIMDKWVQYWPSSNGRTLVGS